MKQASAASCDRAEAVPTPPTLPLAGKTLEAEWAVLIECSKARPDKQLVANKLRAPLDWHALIAFAEDHRILGLVAAKLLEQPGTALPTDALECLRTWQRTYALFSLNLTAEMFQLLHRFRASGVRALVIKGPVLSVRCYGDPGVRQYADLDLVLRDQEILSVTELMTNLGYEATIPISAIRAKKAPGEYNFRNKNSGLLVEFHTERTFRYHPRPLAIENLFHRQSSAKFDSHEVPALSPEDELILICIHGAKHFWERLSYIADVAALVSRQQLDWAKVDAAAAEVSAERMLDLGLRLAQDVLGAPLPDRAQARVRPGFALQKLAAQVVHRLPAAGSAPPGIFERAKFRVRVHGRGLAGLRYLFRLSFSPTEEDWSGKGQPKRPWLLDALGRPFRLARKYGRGNKT